MSLFSSTVPHHTSKAIMTSPVSGAIDGSFGHQYVSDERESQNNVNNADWLNITLGVWEER